MNRDICSNLIAYCLSQIDALLQIKGPNHLFDTNTHLEQTYCGLLNLIYGWKLTNCNIVKLNEANIDLAGPHEDTHITGKKMCVQVSATATARKTRKTLTGFFNKKMDDIYDRLYMVFASAREVTVTDFSDNIPRPFCFDPAIHIINHTVLLRKIESLEDVAQINEIARYLQKEVIENPFYPRLLPMSLPAPDARSGFFIEGSRDALIARVLPRLTTNNPVFICGPGGIGKTQVAQELARKHNFEKGPFLIKYIPPQFMGEEAMVSSILNTPFDGRICEETDLSKRAKAYRERIHYIQEFLAGAVFVVDDFHRFGYKLEELKQEESYVELTRSGICLIFTTRYCRNSQIGIHVEVLSKDMLIDQIQKHCQDKTLSRECLGRLIDLVRQNSMMVSMIADSISEGFLDPEVLYDALASGSYSRIDLPKITDGRTCGEKATILEHMRTLYDITKLDEDARRVLALAVPIEDRKIHGRVFYSALPEQLQSVFNALLDGSWFFRDSGLVEVYPVVRLVCRDSHNLPDADMLRDVLKAMHNQVSKGNVSQCQAEDVRKYFMSAQKFISEDPELMDLYHELINNGEED